MTAPRFKVGDRVQSGEPGSTEHDTGTVRKVIRAHMPGVHGYRVAWEGCGEEYSEEETDLEPFTDPPPYGEGEDDARGGDLGGAAVMALAKDTGKREAKPLTRSEVAGAMMREGLHVTRDDERMVLGKLGTAGVGAQLDNDGWWLSEREGADVWSSPVLADDAEAVRAFIAGAASVQRSRALLADSPTPITAYDIGAALQRVGCSAVRVTSDCVRALLDTMAVDVSHDGDGWMLRTQETRPANGWSPVDEVPTIAELVRLLAVFGAEPLPPEPTDAIAVRVPVPLRRVLDLLISALDSASIKYWLRHHEMPEQENDEDEGDDMREPAEHEDDGCEYVADLPEGFDPDALAWRQGERPWGDVHRDYFAPLVPGGRWRLFVDDTPGSLCKNGTPPIGKADDGGGMVILDLDAVRRGLQVMATECPRHFANLVNEDDDAETADVFVQCCVFGEVIYG